MMQGSTHDIGPLSQIPVGEGRNFLVNGTRIAVFHTHQGGIYATQPDCPHKKGPLADGLLGGTTVICPLHERAFDLRTGEEAGADCRLITYAVAISEAGSVIVTI